MLQFPQLRDMQSMDQFLKDLEKVDHKALATTIDNDSMFPHDALSIQKIMNDTAHYYVLGRTLDAFEQ